MVSSFNYFSLQACLFKYITVAAFCIYAQRSEDAAKGEFGGHVFNSYEKYIVDHGKIMEVCFGISVGVLRLGKMLVLHYVILF